MSSLKEMRDELRELRKKHPEHMPVSKMRTADVSSMIQKLKVHREDTPAVALASPSGPKMYKSATESVKKAKASEFPLDMHADAPKAMKAPKAAEKKETPVVKARAEKAVVVSERGDTAAKKKMKKCEE